MVMISPSMPMTSAIAVIAPGSVLESGLLDDRSTAPATCSRMARTGRSTPAISTIVSRRDRLSRGLLAWTVVSDPS